MVWKIETEHLLLINTILVAHWAMLSHLSDYFSFGGEIHFHEAQNRKGTESGITVTRVLDINVNTRPGHFNNIENTEKMLS